MNTLNVVILIIFGALLGSIGTVIISNDNFDNNVRKQVFDECFNYYSNLDKSRGIDSTTIQTCKDRANEF